MLLPLHPAFLGDVRRALRYTQDEIAAVLGVSKATYYKAESSGKPTRQLLFAVVCLARIADISVDFQALKTFLTNIPPTKKVHVGMIASAARRKIVRLTPTEKRKLAAAQQRLGEFARNYAEYERINDHAALQAKLLADLKVVDSDITGRYAGPFGALFRRFVAIVQRTGALPNPYDL